MNNLFLILSLTPFLIFLFLIFVLKSSLFKSALFTFLSFLVLSVVFWKIKTEAMIMSLGKGFFVSFDIFLIIFGAVMFFELLKKKNIIEDISYYLSVFSKDYRIQVIIIAWFLECLLEGTAGFGVPSAVAVPVLLGIGLDPILSLVVGLLGNSVPGVFGAAGTPIKIGFAGLNVTDVSFYASVFNFVGLIIPIVMIFVIVRWYKKPIKEFLEVVPIALWSGFLFVFPSFLVAVFLGQEFPTIIGAFLGLMIFLVSVKFNFLVPKQQRFLFLDKEKIEPKNSLLKSFLPYLLLIIFLILGKFLFGGVYLNILSYHKFNLFNPGLVFVFTALVFALLYRVKIDLKSIKTAFSGAFVPFMVICFMLMMVQLMVNSGNNFSGELSAVKNIAMSIDGKYLPVISPFVGAFGSFITGSVTTSNVMFGSIFEMASISAGLNTQVVLASLVVGAGLGNMIALADILTAEAVIGKRGFERKIVSKVIGPCLICLLIVVFLVLLFA